ncbi:MAG: exosortase/archaeosortase family protein [Planctomycetes bacterium]|nr:exosortase/archaeosortase family protein [Planctomycetota bacterium]
MAGFFVLLISGICAHASLLLSFFKERLGASDGLFVPVAIGVAALLIWLRRKDFFARRIDDVEDSVRYQRVHGSVPGFWVGAILCAGLALMSNLLGSAHLGWITFLVFLGLLVYLSYGKYGYSGAVPVLVLLYFMKPIPDAWEPWVQLGFQWAASRMAGVILDFLSIFYYYEGVVLGLVSQEGLAVGVCNGVRSLVPAVFLAIAWGVGCRYHWFRTFVNVCQMLFWVVLFNALRIALLMWNQDRGGDWMESWLATSIIEYVSLALILFFAWSGDQLFASIVEPASDALPEGVIDSGLRDVDRKPMVAMSAWTVSVGIILFLVGLISVRCIAIYPWQGDLLRDRILSVQLPGEIDGWKITERPNSNDTERPFVFFPEYGSTVRDWTLEREGRVMRLSIAGSCRRYPGMGWFWKWNGWDMGLESYNRMDKSKSASRRYALLELTRLPGEAGAVVGCGIGPQGVSIPNGGIFGVNDNIVEFLGNAINAVIGTATIDAVARQSHGTPVGSVSLYRKSARKLDTDQIEELKKVFDQVLDRIDANPIDATAKSAPSPNG